MLLFVFSGYSQKLQIDVSAGADRHPANSHIIGTVRNHVNHDVDGTDPATGFDTEFYNKLNMYGAIEPRFGENRKIYRLGGSNIDGMPSPWNLFPGYHWASDYGIGAVAWEKNIQGIPNASPRNPSGMSWETGKRLGAGMHRIFYGTNQYCENCGSDNVKWYFYDVSGFTINVNYLSLDPSRTGISLDKTHKSIHTAPSIVSWNPTTWNISTDCVTGFELTQISGPKSGTFLDRGVYEVHYRVTTKCGDISYFGFTISISNCDVINQTQEDIYIDIPRNGTSILSKHSVNVSWTNHSLKTTGSCIESIIPSEFKQILVPYYDNIDYYIDEANDMNADMLVGINVGSGSPREAAGLVEYLQSIGKLDDVAFFELGQELAGIWQRGHPCNGETYAQWARQFAIAMNTVDPAIKLSTNATYNQSWEGQGQGYDDPSCGNWPDFQTTVNQYLDNFNLDSKTNKDARIDYLGFHGYINHGIGLINEEETKGKLQCNGEPCIDNQISEKLMALNTWAIDNRIKPINDILNTYNQQHTNSDIRLVNTEYTSLLAEKIRPELIHSITEALFTADNMITSFQEDVRAACNFSFHQTLWNNPKTEGSHNNFFEYNNYLNSTIVTKPVFEVHKMVAENFGQDVIPTTDVDFENIVTTAIGTDGNYDYKDIGYVSSIDDDGTVYCLVINRSLDDIDLDFEILNSDKTYLIEKMTMKGDTYTDDVPTRPDYSFNDGFKVIFDKNNITIDKASINIVKFTPCDIGGDCKDITLTTTPENTPLIVTWDEEHVPANSFGTVTVGRGVILNIPEETTLYFCEGGQLIIEEGARVNLLGGTLTSCSQWQGVDVKGNFNEQIITYLGTVDPNADDNDIYAGFNPTNSLSNQGIFYSTMGTNGNAIVENAAIGVNANEENFYSWWATGGGIILSTNTSFLNNNIGVNIGPHPSTEYKAYFTNCKFEANLFQYHVSLTLNRGIPFENTDFLSTIEPDDPYIPEYNIGIRAISAGFDVSGQSDFEKLNIGIKSFAFYRQSPFTCENSNFKECHIGIANDGVSGVTISGNHFDFGWHPTQYGGEFEGIYGSEVQVGVHSQNTIFGIGISNNWFRRTTPNDISYFTYGTYTEDIGPSDANVISNNEFDDLYIDNLAFGYNGTYDVDMREAGLTYRCNLNYHDLPFWFYNDFLSTGSGLMPEMSLKRTQGKLVGSGIYEAAGNYFTNKDGYGSRDFRHHGGSEVQYYYGQDPNEYPNRVENVNRHKAPHNCNFSSIQNPKSSYNTALIGYETAISNRDIAISNGNSETLEQAIQEVNYFHNQMEMAALAGYQEEMNNTVYNETEVRQWLARFNTLAADLMLVNDYLYTQEYANAQNLLNEIETKYQFNTERQLDFQNVKYIYQALMQNTVFNLPTDVITNMTQWADDEAGFAGYISRNILEILGSPFHPIIEPIDLPSPGQERKKSKEISGKHPLSFIISPNPASDNINFALANKSWQGITEIRIIDITGKTVKTLKIPENNSSLNYHVNIPNGIYFCRIVANNEIKMTSKLIIHK